MNDPRAEEHRRQDQRDPDQASLDHPPGPDPVHVEAEEERGGIVIATVNVPHGEWASAFTTTIPSPARSKMRDEEDRRGGGAVRDRADLAAGHLGERRRAVADRGEEDDEVVHRAAERRAEEDPERAGQVSELRREHRARSAGPRREIAAKWWPKRTKRSVRTKSRPSALVTAGVVRAGIEPRDAVGQEGAVVAVGEREDDDRREREDERVHGRGRVAPGLTGAASLSPCAATTLVITMP